MTRVKTLEKPRALHIILFLRRVGRTSIFSLPPPWGTPFWPRRFPFLRRVVIQRNSEPPPPLGVTRRSSLSARFLRPASLGARWAPSKIMEKYVRNRGTYVTVSRDAHHGYSPPSFLAWNYDSLENDYQRLLLFLPPPLSHRFLFPERCPSLNFLLLVKDSYDFFYLCAALLFLLRGGVFRVS